jgi:hypothetical protein
MTRRPNPDPDPEFEAAQQALAKLEVQLGGDPDVSLIDVAFQREPGSQTDSVVLRVHVRDRWLAAKPEVRAAIPSEVDSIPVVVTRGEYEPE